MFKFLNDKNSNDKHTNDKHTNDKNASTIKVYEYNPTFKSYDISVNEYTYLLNGITITPMSKNALEICNILGCTDIELRCLASQYTICYKYIFNGENINENSKTILKNIECGIKPRINKEIYKSIILLKWKLYEYKKNKSFNKISSEWIGVLAGLIYYFDEIDEFNNKSTNYATEICRDLTINDVLLMK